MIVTPSDALAFFTYCYWIICSVSAVSSLFSSRLRHISLHGKLHTEEVAIEGAEGEKSTQETIRLKEALNAFEAAPKVGNTHRHSVLRECQVSVGGCIYTGGFSGGSSIDEDSRCAHTHISELPATLKDDNLRSIHKHASELFGSPPEDEDLRCTYTHSLNQGKSIDFAAKTNVPLVRALRTQILELWNDLGISEGSLLRRCVCLVCLPFRLWHRILVCDVWISKRFFAHFYAVGTVVNSLCLSWMLLNFKEKNNEDISGWDSKNLRFSVSLFSWNPLFSAELIPLLLFQFHVLRRFLEQILMFESSRNSEMHILAYLLGISFYTVIPFTLMVSAGAPSQCVWKQSFLLIGVATFIISFVLQFIAHWKFAHLRRLHGSGRYGIPSGCFFKLTYSPHYALESLLYFSLLLITGSFAMFPCFFFVAATMLVNGWRVSKWYQSKKARLELFDSLN